MRLSGGQQGLAHRVASVYLDRDGAVDNDELYETMRPHVRDIGKREVVDASGQLHDVGHRQVRWVQQTLRRLGVIERVPEARGRWRATETSRKGLAALRDELTPATPGVVMLATRTDLGLSLWGLARDVAERIDEPVHLMLTSPPYPLAKPRAYGNPTANEYTDFICDALEPLVRTLAPGGSVCLNLTNDCFVAGSPARSTYRERLVIALEDRLGLHKMNELIWANPQKPPGPVQWCSLSRQQLSTGYEPIYWFTNDPKQCFANNRRVLQPHTPKHLALIAKGGEQRAGIWSDGAHRLRVGSFAKPTAGRIPRDVLAFGHRCPSMDVARRLAQDANLPTHGAPMPLALATFLIEFLTAPGQLVVDLFAGWSTTGVAAQATGRRWICVERMLQYAQASSLRFEWEA